MILASSEQRINIKYLWYQECHFIDKRVGQEAIYTHPMSSFAATSNEWNLTVVLVRWHYNATQIYIWETAAYRFKENGGRERAFMGQAAITLKIKKKKKSVISNIEETSTTVSFTQESNNIDICIYWQWVGKTALSKIVTSVAPCMAAGEEKTPFMKVSEREENLKFNLQQTQVRVRSHIIIMRNSSNMPQE